MAFSSYTERDDQTLAKGTRGTGYPHNTILVYTMTETSLLQSGFSTMSWYSQEKGSELDLGRASSQAGVKSPIGFPALEKSQLPQLPRHQACPKTRNYFLLRTLFDSDRSRWLDAQIYDGA